MQPMTTSPHDRTSRRGARARRGAVPLEALLAGLTTPMLRRQGFVRTELVRRWTSIVGPQFASMAVPERLSFPEGQRRGGVLTVRAAGPLVTLLQHALPQVIERVNGVFGYRAIERVRLVQGVVPPRIGGPGAQRPAVPHPVALPESLPEGPLRSALAALASTIPEPAGPDGRTVATKAGDNPQRAP